VDFLIRGHRIAVDLKHTLVDWQFTLFKRDQKSLEFLSAIVSSKSMQVYSPQIQLKDGRYLLASWDIHVTQIDLQDSVSKWVNAILLAATEHQASPNAIDS
jgi:hypothetical protein